MHKEAFVPLLNRERVRDTHCGHWAHALARLKKVDRTLFGSPKKNYKAQTYKILMHCDSNTSKKVIHINEMKISFKMHVGNGSVTVMALQHRAALYIHPN